MEHAQFSNIQQLYGKFKKRYLNGNQIRPHKIQFESVYWNKRIAASDHPLGPRTLHTKNAVIFQDIYNFYSQLQRFFQQNYV